MVSFFTNKCCTSYYNLSKPLIHHGKKPISVKTLYNYISQGEFPNIKKAEHSRCRGKRKYSRKTNYNTIHPDRIIPEWPDEIISRSRVGDWEGDTFLGAVGKGGIVTFAHRKTRYLVAGLIPDKVESLGTQFAT